MYRETTYRYDEKKASLSSLSEKGVEVREADFSDAQSLETAFKGAERLLLISIDAIGQRSELHKNAVRAADKAGVKYISYTSMPAADKSPVVFAFEHEATERAIAESSIHDWTILRNNWYFENLPEFFGNVLQTGTWLTAAGQGRSAQIARNDLAYAAAASLAKGQVGQQTLTLNGPNSLTMDEMVALINKELATNVTVAHMSDEAYKSQLESFDLPGGLVAMLTTMDIHGRENYSDGMSSDFETLTGRKPKSFAAWLKDNREMLLSIANG
ncbi:NADPH:quinone oxidoreductase 2 [Vibrio maritimus]|uniref:NADPH:quinone oxidoreductase 2 n=1 Tax=Vibrio maritimus TaxID=990268 RepID=A0A090RS54_9VIBR|nr:NADPH:quinone oxidoreductase 2 [Vibrio maritimus]